MNTEHALVDEPLQADGAEPGSVPEPDADPNSAGALAPITGDDRPQICITLMQLPEAVEAARQALAAYNEPPVLFDHGGELVRFVRSGGGDGQPPRLVHAAVRPPGRAGYAARWFEQSEKGVRPIYPPPQVVHALMYRLGGCVPTLRGVVRVPTYGPDWRLIDRPGYHADPQVYYDPDHDDLPPVPDRPTRRQVTEARRLICDGLLGDFPFSSQADRAAAVAPLILPFVRGRIDGATPLHLIDSPGSGKTLLADVVAIPSLGREPAATTEVANADDLRKSVTSLAVAGEPVVLIDNVNSRLGGSALAAALTKVEWSDRIVGSSRLAKESMTCLWLATGNNVSMTPGLARRVVRCRIDASVPRPHLRDGFRHADLRAWAKAQRPRLIWAALTLVQNWLARGRPDRAVTLGSYEAYARVIGGILLAAGIEGFLASVGADQRYADDETAEWEAFVRAWHEWAGERSVGSGDLDEAILSRNEEMLALTLSATGGPRGRRVRLGQALRRRRDAVIAGRRIKVSDRVDRHGCWHYHLEVVSGQ